MEDARPDISSETVAWIVLKARAYDVQVAESDPEEASDSPDDRAVSVLEDQADNPARLELYEAIESLSDDEQAVLVALVWIGRGDMDAGEWEGAVSLATERRRGPTVDYLMGIPLLGDYLSDGAAAVGILLPSGSV